MFRDAIVPRDVAGVVFVLLLLAVLFLPLQGLRIDLSGARVSLNASSDKPIGLLASDYLLYAAGVLALLGPAWRRPRPRLARLLTLGLLLLAIGGVLGLLTAELAADSARIHIRMVGLVVVCFAAVWASHPAGARGLLLVAAYVTASSLSAALGVAGALIGPAGGEFENGVGRAVGLAGNAGALGVVTAIGLALALPFALEARSGVMRWALAASVVVQGGALLVSGTRGAAVSALVVVAMVVAAAIRTGRARRAAIAVVALAVVGALGVVGVIRIATVDRLLLRTDTPVSSGSVESMDLHLGQVDEELDARGWHSLLIGSGLRDLEPTEESRREGSLRDPHSGHLEVWIGLGLAGLVGWALVAVATIAPGARLLLRREPPSGDDLVLVGLSLAYVSFVVSAFTANNVWNRYIWLVVALAAFAAWQRGEEGSTRA